MSRQQQETEQQRLQETLEALERIRQDGAKERDVELLARELGVYQWIKKGTEHESVKSH